MESIDFASQDCKILSIPKPYASSELGQILRIHQLTESFKEEPKGSNFGSKRAQNTWSNSLKWDWEEGGFMSQAFGGSDRIRQVAHIHDASHSLQVADTLAALKSMDSELIICTKAH